MEKLEKFHHQIVAGSEEHYFAVFDKILQVTRHQVEIYGEELGRQAQMSDRQNRELGKVRMISEQ